MMFIYGKYFVCLLVAMSFLLIANIIVASNLMPLKSGFLDLGNDEVIFHYFGAEMCHRKYKYHDVFLLYYGYCPMGFTKKISRTSFISKEDWREMYGKYIVALDSSHEVMFTCGYSDNVWGILSEKCGETAKVMTEEQYEGYKESMKAIESETELNNGYHKEVKKYDGYIN